MWGDPIFVRSIERLIAVAVGGLAIWCGYRLFLAVPDLRSDGRAELTWSKDKRLVVTRLGPGTFFGLFGTFVVISSFYFPVTARLADGTGWSGMGSRTADASSLAATPQAMPYSALDDVEIRKLIAFLLEFERSLPKESNEAQRDERENQFRNARLAILERGWQASWGDPLEFRVWLGGSTPRSRRPEFERALAVLEGRV